MRLHTVSTPAQRTGQLRETRATAVMGAKMFSVLSHLYSDPWKACLRELSTNAYDAHVAAGRPERPIRVSLPDAEDPFLAVRDFGRSLTPRQMFRIYLTYFMSTKDAGDDADSYNGCLGLGSKSPFALEDHGVDQFQVTTYRRTKAGSHTIAATYTAFLEDGEPHLNLLSRQWSDEKPGTEVRVPVLSGNMHRFHEAAKSVFAYFRVAPELRNTNVVPKRPAYSLRTETMGLRESGTTNQGSRVVMGDTAYPLDANVLRLPDSKKLEKALIKYGVDLYVPIGAVKMTPSREALEYTARTVAAIEAAASAAVPVVVAKFVDKIAAAPTLWEARVALHAMRGSVSWAGDLPAPSRDGQAVTLEIKLRDEVPAGFRFTTLRSHGQHSRKALVEPVVDLDEVRAYVIHAAGPCPVLFVDDVPRQIKATIKAHFLATGERNGLVFDDGTLPDEFLAREGIAHRVVRLSTVERPKPKPRAKKEKRPKTLLRQVTNFGYSWSDEAEVDVTAGGVYIETVRDSVRITQDGSLRDPSNSSSFFRSLAALEGTPTPIYGVRTADIARLKKQGNWRPVQQHATAILTKKAKTLARPVALLTTDNTCRYDELLAHRYAEGSVFGRFARLRRAVLACSRYRAEVKEIQDLAGWLQQYGTIGGAKDLLEAQEALTTAYPLLGTRSYIDAARAPAYRDYIEMVDARRAEAEGRPKRKRTRKAVRPVLQLTGT